MEVCGTHTMNAFRSGLHSLLPHNVSLLSGPGCPVCVTSQADIDQLIELSRRPGVTLCTYGDMLRVSGSEGSLEQARAQGADVRIIYSSLEAVQLAAQDRRRPVAFAAVGFETTTPATVAALLEAQDRGLDNFTILTSHKLILPAMRALLESGDIPIDGFLCPGHVAVILGASAFEPIVREYHKPCVIAGFEGPQIAEAIARLSELVAQGTPALENLYSQAVTPQGNIAAQRLVDRFFAPADCQWRGLGLLGGSGLVLRPEFSRFDARLRFGLGATQLVRSRVVVAATFSPADSRRRSANFSAWPVIRFGRSVRAWSAPKETCQAYFKYQRPRAKFRAKDGPAPTCTCGVSFAKGAGRSPRCRRRRREARMIAPGQPRLSQLPSHISLAHGGGGQLTDELIGACILSRLGNPVLDQLLDSAILDGAPKLAMTIDSYVVEPLKFSGGDIGRLAVCGTVNDLAVCGATPLGLALSLILTEGLPRTLLEEMIDSIAAAAKEAGVRVVTGDTKVIGRSGADGGDQMFITTAGVGAAGRAAEPRAGSPRRHHPGQRHDCRSRHGGDAGAADAAGEKRLRSDVAPLNAMIRRLLEKVEGVVFMRDPTRGGLAGVVADLAQRSGLHVTLNEQDIPVQPQTLHAADMLGIDVLDVANEGKIVVVVRPEQAQAALQTLREDPHGQNAAIIGVVESTPDACCELRTEMGGSRILQKPYGEQLPRIC